MMSEPQPNPKVTNKVSPLAVIVVIIIIGIVVVALVNRRGHHQSASGVNAPMAQSNGVMPEQSNVPNGVVPASANSNDAVEATPTGNDVGNPGAGGIGNSTR
jgi:ABC-type uncharacterized transport system permease subunit